MGCNYTEVIAKPCKMMPEREGERERKLTREKTNAMGETHRHMHRHAEDSESRWGEWERGIGKLGILGFGVSRSQT
jgi:hypothetical protein